MAAAGSPVYRHEGLRLEKLDTRDAQEEAGTLKRVPDGRFCEKLP